MSELRARLRRWREAVEDRLPPRWNRVLAGVVIAIGIALPFFFPPTSGFMNATIIAVAYAVMALGLNIVVGFAGLLDLGYVAFYALGAYSLGWFGSGFFFKARVHVLVSPTQRTLAGAAGLVYALYETNIWYFQGFRAGLFAFTAAVMGGIGNVRGAVLGGLIIGVIQALSDSRLGPQWTEAVVFGYLIAIMVLRPRGLLGEETREAG